MSAGIDAVSESMDIDSLDSPMEFSKVNVSSRSDQETILKTIQQASQAIHDHPEIFNEIRSSNPPENAKGINRTALPVLQNQSTEALHNLRNQAATELMEIVESVPTDKKPSLNIMFKLGELVRDILILTNDISERNRAQADELRIKCYTDTSKSADSQRYEGKAGLGIAILSFCVQFGALAFTSENDQKLVRAIADQIPNGGSLFTTQARADATIANNRFGMNSSELTNKTQVGQNDTLKDPSLSALQAAQRLFGEVLVRG